MPGCKGVLPRREGAQWKVILMPGCKGVLPRREGAQWKECNGESRRELRECAESAGALRECADSAGALGSESERGLKQDLCRTVLSGGGASRRGTGGEEGRVEWEQEWKCVE